MPGPLRGPAAAATAIAWPVHSSLIESIDTLPIPHIAPTLHHSQSVTAAGGSAECRSRPHTAASLWLLIAPFDHRGAYLGRCLWPLLRDWEVLQAMTANSATVTHLCDYTPRHVFRLSELCPQPHSNASSAVWTGLEPIHRTPSTSARYRPYNISAAVEADWDKLPTVMPHLSRVTSLHLTSRRPPDSYCADGWPAILPPSLTDLRLTVSGRAWRVLAASCFPSALHELTIDSIHDSQPRTQLLSCWPLPPHLHTINIRTHVPDWSAFQRLHLPPHSSQLRSLTLAFESTVDKVDVTQLPRSLTELELGGCCYEYALSDFQLPHLVTLRLGQPLSDQPVGGQWIAADSFVGLPVLRELDLRLALAYRTALSAGVLPDTLTSLSLPLNYRPRIAVGALPASVRRLQIAHTCDSDTDEASRLADGCLPAALHTLIVKQVKDDHSSRRRDYLPPPLPFTQHLSILPASLVELQLVHHTFNQSLDPLIDLPHLATLSIDSNSFSQPLDPISHLARLHTLELFIHFPSPLPVLPAQLHHLTVRPTSEEPHRPSAAFGLARSGYTHSLTAQQFALCTQLESVSIDADQYDGWLYLYVFDSWEKQQQKCPVFDSPIAEHVLPASLQRLRLPQHYRYAQEVVVPEMCRVWKGADRVDFNKEPEGGQSVDLDDFFGPAST